MSKPADLRTGNVIRAGERDVKVERVTSPYRGYGRTVVTVHGTTADSDAILATVDMDPDTDVEVVKA